METWPCGPKHVISSRGWTKDLGLHVHLAINVERFLSSGCCSLYWANALFYSADAVLTCCLTHSW